VSVEFANAAQSSTPIRVALLLQRHRVTAVVGKAMSL
jgi:hypothetical protein